MKKTILISLAVLLPFLAGAQTFGGRASVEASYKIARGLHVSVEEEIRAAEGYDLPLGSLRTGIGLSYKPSKSIKFSAGYININTYKSYGFANPRHRLYGDVTGTCRIGDFAISLRERLQFTHRTESDLNVYQSTRNALALKSRISVKYKGISKQVEPYAAFEIRTFLNGPWGTTTSSTLTLDDDNGKSYYSYSPSGYTHLYNNRYRINLGVEFAPSKRHSITPYVLLDYCQDYELDTNKKGTKLYSAEWVTTFLISPGFSYTYSF